MQNIEVRRYVTRNGRDVFGDWLAGLKDMRTRAKVAIRVDRLAAGNFGDCKSLGDGLYEMRIDWGPGYRVYFTPIGRTCVLLLGGGDKRRQGSDIREARERLRDYRERTQ